MKEFISHIEIKIIYSRLDTNGNTYIRIETNGSNKTMYNVIGHMTTDIKGIYGKFKEVE